MVGTKNDTFDEIFSEESFKGERTHWLIHWLLNGIILILSMLVYFVQGIVVGKYGIYLSLFTLSYNLLISWFIIKRKRIPWNGYVMVSINVISLTIYNFWDSYYISPLAPVTTATIMLYPVIIFIAFLRMNKKLIAWATFLSLLSMNGLYIYFYNSFDPSLITKIVSADPLGQFYRSIYLAMSGALIYQVPKSLLRVLKTQERLIQENITNRRLAQHDALTGVYNRLYFEQHLENCIELAHKYHYKIALLFIDLDGFKILNDTFGHDAGDFILKEVATDLRKTLRESDMVARFGGDEFVVVMSPLNHDYKESGFESRLLNQVSQKRIFNKKELTISASIGAAIYPDDATNISTLIKCADAAMYEVKKSGKNNIRFHQKS
ncbi:MAG: hypothetical protein CVU98_08825 [Firmicutes bacterium HGW-Firmicutes-3]|jgi:diguanylate cyclase (GGDEF)-like protein|nr:MAG: hypothetical protein CVU98_08825 [Firmicutes bacterium HGW-Firmicutes-3]